jgi:hypothetical protein
MYSVWWRMVANYMMRGKPRQHRHAFFAHGSAIFSLPPCPQKNPSKMWRKLENDAGKTFRTLQLMGYLLHLCGEM